MLKHKWSFAFILMLIFSLTVVGCGKDEGTNTDAGSITVAGSTSVQPLSEELAKAYKAINPNITINVQGGGSSQGLRAAENGIAQIGASSRALKDSEKGELKETIIANDGIAVIIHPQNDVTDLTIMEIKDIFSGKTTNWKDLGGKDTPINIVTREAGSGTRNAFQEIVIGDDSRISDRAITQSSNGAIKTTVANDVNSIGFLSIGFIESDVKPIKVNGVEATEENILNETYKITRPFIYLTKGEPDGEVKKYIDFVLSPEGQEIVGKDYVKVK